MNTKVTEILTEVKKVILGKDEIIEKVLMAMLAKGHILLDDVPGVGKTTLALAFSRAMGLSYKRVQFTPDVVPSDIVGFTLYNKETGAFDYKPGAVMCNLLLVDEINRASSKTQSALLEVMEEGQSTVDGVTHPLPEPFLVIATQNPVGSAGTQMLPQVQLDRFMIRTRMGYPALPDQINILMDRQTENPLDHAVQVAGREEILAMQQEVVQVEMKEVLVDYVARLAEATRNHPLVELGVSPRGALACCRLSKARAYVQGRDFVTTEDILSVFKDVCAHRIILSLKSRISETNAENVLDEVLAQVESPDALAKKADGKKGSDHV